MKTKFMKFLMATLLTLSTFVGMAQSQPSGSVIVKRLEAVLCPDQKPVGSASAMVGVRVVTVKDFSDANAYLLRICPQREIKEEKRGGNVYYTYVLPDGKGELVLTDKVKAGTKEVAVLEVRVPEFKDKVSEIRFTK